MADGGSPALYEVLGRLAEAVGDKASSGDVAQRMRRLVGRSGLRGPDCDPVGPPAGPAN